MIDWPSIRALTFDCFGTLVDWETGILRDLRTGLATDAGDDRLLTEYGAAEAALEAGPFMPYRAVLRGALLGVASAVGARVIDPDALVAGLPSWPVFDDTSAALTALGRHFRLCIVSNVDRDLFEGTRLTLGARLDEIVTADQVRSYKPGFAHLEEAMRRLDVDHTSLVHVAQSLFHDIEPARVMGLHTVWVDRRAGHSGGATRPPRGAPTPDLTVHSLAELAAVVAKS
jgi:2-haloacid dehalogenase